MVTKRRLQIIKCIFVFFSMFDNRADVKMMFEQFRATEEEHLSGNESLENHAVLVMNALDEAITNLDDESYLVDMLKTTGKSHRRFEDFSTVIFWVRIYIEEMSSFQIDLKTCFINSYYI